MEKCPNRSKTNCSQVMVWQIRWSYGISSFPTLATTMESCLPSGCHNYVDMVGDTLLGLIRTSGGGNWQLHLFAIWECFHGTLPVTDWIMRDICQHTILRWSTSRLTIHKFTNTSPMEDSLQHPDWPSTSYQHLSNGGFSATSRLTIHKLPTLIQWRILCNIQTDHPQVTNTYPMEDSLQHPDWPSTSYQHLSNGGFSATSRLTIHKLPTLIQWRILCNIQTDHPQVTNTYPMEDSLSSLLMTVHLVAFQ